MNITTATRTIAAMLAFSVMLWACGPRLVERRPPGPPPTAPLSAGETVAGEILAYLMEVVLGRAGPPANRTAWATRGTRLPLSFDLVEKRMHGPVNQRAELMVLDTNILGLSQVLYHYDPRLNLFKGRRGHDSLYPCSELMALRLLLLRKLEQGERVSLAAILRHHHLFADPVGQADDDALAAMNLNADEFRFLRAVFLSEPAFWRYLQHPFIVSTLKRLGIAAQDTATLMADQAANYRASARPKTRQRQPGSIVAILPSMTALFDDHGGRTGIAPSPDYRQLSASLISGLRDGVDRRLASNGHAPAGDRLVFWWPDRPLVIHPQNAGRVVEEVCPQADFVVVVLGKNVYRAMHIDPARDVYPHERRVYLDVDDIRYQNLDDAHDNVATALVPRLVR